MDLEKALSHIRLERPDVLNVYVMGSRMWGNERPDSDWDLLVVVKDCTRTRERARAPGTLHFWRLNVSILDESTFRQRVAAHAFIETMALHAPSKNVWLDSLRIKAPAFDRKSWEAAIKYRVDRNLALIKKSQKPELVRKTEWYTICTTILGEEFIRWNSLGKKTPWDPTLAEQQNPKN